MARSDPQVNLRMPAELKDALDAAAAENKRSLTAEVVARLQASFENSTWAKTFPQAAASAHGDRAFQEATAALVTQQLQIGQLVDRLQSLESQLVGLDAQAISLQREALRVQFDIEQADARKEGRTVAALLRQRQETAILISRVDAQASALRRALDATKKQLAAMPAQTADLSVEVPAFLWRKEPSPKKPKD